MGFQPMLWRGLWACVCNRMGCDGWQCVGWDPEGLGQGIGPCLGPRFGMCLCSCWGMSRMGLQMGSGIQFELGVLGKVGDTAWDGVEYSFRDKVWEWRLGQACRNAFPAARAACSLGNYTRRRAEYCHIHTHIFYIPFTPPTHTNFFSYLIDIPPFGPLSFTNGAFDSAPNAVWAHKMVVGVEPFLIFLSLTMGTPKTAGVM